MAGLLTHAYFTLDLYDKLSIRSKELLLYEKENLKVFSLGNDVLYYYKKKDKKMKAFSIYTKNNKVYDFLSTLINYIKYNNHQYNPQVISYLYSVLSHYVLDTTINPFIIYKTGIFNKDDSETFKYNMLGEELNVSFDNYLTTIKFGTNPYKFKMYDYCFNVDNFNKELIEVIDFTYKEVFNIDNFHSYYFTSIKDSKEFYKKRRYDPKGIKKKKYHLYDLVHSESKIRKVPLSYHTRIDNRDDFFNLYHNTWFNPCEKRIKSNESILELYTKALDKCSKMIQEVNQFLYYDKKINLKKVIGNLSYETGRDCSKKKELKYFDF